MSITTPPPVSARADVRALLVAQQQRTYGVVPMPRTLQAPLIAALWCAMLVVLVAFLALARVRIPRVTPATVLAVSPPGAGQLAPAMARIEPVLLLPPGAAPFVQPGQLAAIDTGAPEPLVLSIVSVEAGPVDVAEARRRYAGSPSVIAAFRTPHVVAHLGQCHAGVCLPLTPGAAFDATARLGTRSLASYAIPGS